jgi:hypothetical protein
VKKKVLALWLFLALLFPLGTAAQNETLANVLVDLWPEFDRPTMLVIYHLTLSPQTSLPFQMELRIPASVGAPHAVAAKQPDGSLVNIPYQQKAENEWTRIVFQATSPEIQFEYYDPNLVKTGNQRSFRYTWPGDYAVQAFSLDIQQPNNANNMQVIPNMATPQEGSDGLTYYHVNVGSLSSGQVFEIRLQYQKPNDELSVSNMKVAPSAPLDDSTPGSMSLPSLLPWILGFFGLALIVGGGVWYWQSGRQTARPVGEERSRHRPRGASTVSEAEEQGNIYCHECGKRASPGDRFCRACGAPLRIN